MNNKAKACFFLLHFEKTLNILFKIFFWLRRKIYGSLFINSFFTNSTFLFSKREPDTIGFIDCLLPLLTQIFDVLSLKRFENNFFTPYLLLNLGSFDEMIAIIFFPNQNELRKGLLLI